jgi:hypothetical protein
VGQLDLQIGSQSLSITTSAEEGTVVSAVVVRNQAGSGTCQVSSGFPVPPGLVTESTITTGKIVVKISGTEVAANVTGLRGRHNDDTFRSVLIQFTSPSMAQYEEATATVTFNGAVRAYADPAYILPTYAMVQNANYIIPTDADYLCSTEVGLAKLLPEGDGSVSEEKYFTTFAEAMITATTVDGSAHYDIVSAWIQLWCRTADHTYLDYMYSVYREPGAGRFSDITWITSLARRAYATDSGPWINPDNITPVSEYGVAGEWFGLRVRGMAVSYLLTGYNAFWGRVAFHGQGGTSYWTSSYDATKVIPNAAYYPRTYLANGLRNYNWIYPLSCIDATGPAACAAHWGTKNLISLDLREWAIQALIDTTWNIAWIPFGSGSGTIPALGTTVSQGGASASCMGVYNYKGDWKVGSTYYSRLSVGAAMPASGYLQIDLSTLVGNFAAGALTLSGATLTATGAEEADINNGVTGLWANANRVSEGPCPIFQHMTTCNEMIAWYLYLEKDARIPPIVKGVLDAVLQHFIAIDATCPRYGQGSVQWGYPAWVSIYEMTNPAGLGYANQANYVTWYLGFFPQVIAFVLGIYGDYEVNGADLSVWYERAIHTGQANPTIMTYIWKVVGEYWSFSQHAPWMMAQDDLAATAPTTYRTPTYWATMPGATPDYKRAS